MSHLTLVEPPEHESIIRPREMYSQPECPEGMVWDICNYLRDGHGTCTECPRQWNDSHHGPVQNGCFATAHEACRIALAWQERIARGGPFE